MRDRTDKRPAADAAAIALPGAALAAAHELTLVADSQVSAGNAFTN